MGGGASRKASNSEVHVGRAVAADAAGVAVVDEGTVERAEKQAVKPKVPPDIRRRVAPTVVKTKARHGDPLANEDVAPVQAKAKPSKDEFMDACRDGDEYTVQAFLFAEARTSQGLFSECEEKVFDSFGDSALHHAIYGGQVSVVEMLLEIGKLQVDIPNARNESALQLVCRRGDLSLARVMIQAQADPDRKDSGGLTPFLSAVFAGACEEMLNLLIRTDSTVNAQDSRGVGALHFAALRGDSTLTEWLLMRKAWPDWQTEHSTTPLMLAAKRGHADSVSLLLGCKASTSLADEAGFTALMHALSGGCGDAAQKLLDGGASIDAVDCAGRSPLFHAVLGGLIAGVDTVILRGGRVNILDDEGRSPLYQACLMGQDALAKRLLTADADPNLAGRGSTVRPLRSCASLDDKDCDTQESDIEREYFAARACLDEARTCLQVCATLAHNDLLTNVLEHGADINAAPGALVWTSLHLCSVINNEKGAALLLARGAAVNMEDAEGNTAEALAERADNILVLGHLREAKAAAPKTQSSAALWTEANTIADPASVRKTFSFKGALPPLHSASVSENAPDETVEPLAIFKEEWQERANNDSLFDRVVGSMVHDALMSDIWRVRWEAYVYLSKNLPVFHGDSLEVVRAACAMLVLAANDRVSKVFLAAVSLFEELLSNERVDAINTDEFAALLRGLPHGENIPAGSDVLSALLDQTDTGSGGSSKSSPQQAAADALSSCIMQARATLDDVALPLLQRIQERLSSSPSCELPQQGRKNKASSPKSLTANLKLLGRWLNTFGLQQSGIFRRALVLPLLLRAAASEHSKVRVVAGESIVQLISLSGGMEERLWQLLPSKARKGLQRLAQAQDGIVAVAVVPCSEDAMKKDVLVADDARARHFICIDELTVQVWTANATIGGVSDVEASFESTERKKGNIKNTFRKELIGEINSQGDEDELRKAFTSETWKERSERLARLVREFAEPCGDGVKCIEENPATPCQEDAVEGPLLSQYVLRGRRISSLQAHLAVLLGDTVTAVFVGAADLLRLVCGKMPLHVAPLFLEPLMPPLVSRLLDTSKRVRGKTTETVLHVAVMHGCALSERISQWLASGSAWCGAPPLTVGCYTANGCDKIAGRDLQTGPRLELLVQLVQTVQDQEAIGRWTEDAWQALADYAVKAAEHRNSDVRKGAARLVGTLEIVGGSAATVAERAMISIRALAAETKMARRPGTTSTRPATGSTRLGTAGSRPGTGTQLNASGHLSNLGSTGGFTVNMTSTGRLSTASKRSGTGFRPGTGLTIKYNPSGGPHRTEDVDEESDNSIHSDAPALDIDSGDPPDEDGDVRFFDVTTCCPGPDEIITLGEGETALKEALPDSEPLDQVALDFVAPLIALFGEDWTRCFYSRQWQCRVAALIHLCACMSHRLEAISGPETTSSAIGELLDGAMRAVHEGLGDQNVKVYSQACVAVNAVVPAFCGTVDGRLLVAHLAPLLRQLCSRMGDSKEIVRLQTVQALFRLLRPPTGNIVSPLGICTLILRHMAPLRNSAETAQSSPSNIGQTTDKGARVGWLCRIGALRDLIKEYPKSVVDQPGNTDPGHWLRLKDGFLHGDSLVRYESARLYALACKATVRSFDDDEEQNSGRETWLKAISIGIPPKSVSQLRGLLKLPQEEQRQTNFGRISGLAMTGNSSATLQGTSSIPWDIPSHLAAFAGSPLESLGPLRTPMPGDEKAVVAALNILIQAVTAHGGAPSKVPQPDVFADVCRAVQQSLASSVGSDRSVFLAAVELCQLSVNQFGASLSGLDINMGLGKTIPVLMERTSVTGASDVKVGVASDKFVQQLAKHPKVGAEAVTKMVISAVSRTERPIRPLVLLRTLLGDFGLRLCAKKDVVMLLLDALGSQLERLKNVTQEEAGGSEVVGSTRSQLIGVLATVHQFSSDTVRYCMSDVDAGYRQLLCAALQEIPDPKLVALGATAGDQVDGSHVFGSASRAASRSRDARGLSASPCSAELNGTSPHRRTHIDSIASSGTRSKRFPGLPFGSDDAREKSALTSQQPCTGEGIRAASPRNSNRRNRRIFRHSFGHASTGSLNGNNDKSPTSTRDPRWNNSDGTKPPAPMGLSTHCPGDGAWRFNGEEATSSCGNGTKLHRVTSSDSKLLKPLEKPPNDNLLASLSVLQNEFRGKTR